MIELPPLALSVRQPWAWAIIHAGKRLENRGRNAVRTGHMTTGPLCIHASRGMTRDEYESAADWMKRIRDHYCWSFEVPRPDELVRGAIIGTVDVVDVIKKSSDPWFIGPRALVLENPRACAPVPCLGALGYFQWAGRATDVEEASKPWMTAWPEQARRPNARPVSPPQPDLLA